MNQIGLINTAFKDSDENLDRLNNVRNQNDEIEFFNETTLKEKFTYKKIKSNNIFKDAGHYARKYYKPSGNCMKNLVLQRFPVIEWLLHYNLRENFVKDLIAGITVK